MYIKYKGNASSKTTIINANVSSCKDITTENEFLIIKMEKDTDTIKLSFENVESAILAQEKLFLTLGLKSPYSNVLDLTDLSEIKKSGFAGISMQDIADKFNVDLRELSIIAVPKLELIGGNDKKLEGGE